MIVPGVPNTTGCRSSLAPSEALNTLAGLPVATYFSRFWTTNSAEGAMHRMCFPLLIWCMVRAMAAMMWLLPAPVAASITHGSVQERTQSMTLSWAVCW